MAMMSIICLDADLDIRELATMLIPDLAPDNNVYLLREPYSGSPVYGFKKNRTEICLRENHDTVEIPGETARYRYYFDLMYGERSKNFDMLYDYLQQRGCFPLARRVNQDVTDATFEPLGATPQFSVVTRLMPVEIVLRTSKQRSYVRRELSKLTGLDFSLGRDYHSNSPPGIIWSFREVPKRWLGEGRYLDSGSKYSTIHVLGTDDHPVRRRAIRDAFAGILFAKIQAGVRYPVEIYGVIAGEFRPFSWEPTP